MDTIIVYVDDAEYAKPLLQAMAQAPGADRRHCVLVACAPRITHRVSRFVSNRARELAQQVGRQAVRSLCARAGPGQWPAGQHDAGAWTAAGRAGPAASRAWHGRTGRGPAPSQAGSGRPQGRGTDAAQTGRHPGRHWRAVERVDRRDTGGLSLQRPCASPGCRDGIAGLFCRLAVPSPSGRLGPGITRQHLRGAVGVCPGTRLVACTTLLCCGA